MVETEQLVYDFSKLSNAEKEEMMKLGMLSKDDQIREFDYDSVHFERPPITKHAVHAPEVINEAYNYARPSSFSRALRLDFGGYKILLVSGTASVNEEGKAAHSGNFRAQCWRTYRNINQLLNAEGMTWHDVIRTTNYLRDIERDYKAFNQIRSAFFQWLKLDPLPASTGIQAILCWPNLLVEIEALAVCKPN